MEPLKKFNYKGTGNSMPNTRTHLNWLCSAKQYVLASVLEKVQTFQSNAAEVQIQ